ncbi:MAG: metallophosphoesterase [Anaerolineae bacterium]|nr:metallophosphoesterase [Anaerolineae bacterium]MBK9231952.1 metallophosphoesterase [Anaerolineae bacterium]
MNLGGLRFARRHWGLDWFEIKHLTLTLPRLAPEFRGYRLLQISDIHMDGWMTQRRLTAIMDLVNQQQPDLVAITGDFVTYATELFVADLRFALSRLAPPDGTVVVLGNHDHWQQPELLRQMFRDVGLLDLNNAVHTVRRGNACLHLAGVDDVRAGAARLDQVLAQLPPTDCAILLAHEPDFADVAAATGRFDLQLSGHSHGGQIVLPFIGPPFLPSMGRKYPIGRYTVRSMTLYTNRGLGVIPRLNCRPEISVFTLL